MTTYYVAQSNGSNGNTGGASDPWRTITYAISQATTSDTIIVRGGTYAERVNVSKALTVQAYAGETVWVDGAWTYGSAFPNYANFAVSDQWDAMLVISADSATVDGINVKDSAGRGILVTGDSATIKNLTVNHCLGGGIILYISHNDIIQDVKILRASQAMRFVGDELAGWPHTVAPVRSENSTWTRVEIYESEGEGFSAYTGLNATWDSCKIVNCSKPQVYVNFSPGLIVKNCEVYYTASYVPPFHAFSKTSAIKFADEDGGYTRPNYGITRDVQIYNNVIAGAYYGLVFSGGTQHCANAVDVLIANNTIIAEGYYAVKVANILQTNRQISNCVVENNIFVGGIVDGTSAGNIMRNITWRYNYWGTTPSSWMQSGGDTSGTLGLVTTSYAPALVTATDVDNHDDFAATDYHLTASSPAVEAALPNAITTDYLGNLRDGSTPDQGWHEYDGSAPSESVTLTAGFTMSANRVEESTAVTLTDTSSISTGAIDSWAWEYKLATATSWTSHSTSSTPANLTIATAGDYQVRLTVTDTESSQSDAYVLALTITAAGADDAGSCTGNTLTNSDFASGTTGWTFSAGGGAGSFAAGSSYADITVTTAAGNMQLYQTGINITEGQTYTLSFRATGTETRILRFFLFDNTTIADLGMSAVEFNVTTNWLVYTHTFVALASSSSNARLQIRPGWPTGSVQIDDLCLAPYTAPTVPEAVITVPSNPATVGVEQTLNSSSSTGSPTSYSWEIDGVDVGTSSTYAWTPASPRSYTIALTVINAYGSDTSTITVEANVASSGGTVAALLADAVPGSTGSDGGTDHADVGTTGGVITLLSNATVAGTAADGARIGAGFSDGSNEYAVALASEHNVGTTNTDSRTEAAALYLMDNSNVLADGDVALTDADTTTITWNTVAAGKLYAALRIAATNAAAGTFVPAAADVNVGFQPDIVFVLSSKPGNSAFGGTAGVIAQFSLGWKTADGERSLAWYSDNGSAASRTFARMSDSYSGMTLDTSGGALSNGVNLTITATGFSHTNTGSMADSMAYLALKLDGLGTQIVDFDTPISTGTDSQSTEFEPGAAISLASLVVAFDTVESDDDASVASVGFWDGANSRAVAVSDDDGADPTVTKSLVDDVFLLVPAANGAANISADVYSVSGSSFTLNYTAVDATQRKISVLLIEASSALANINYLQPGVATGTMAGMP